MFGESLAGCNKDKREIEPVTSLAFGGLSLLVQLALKVP
jgi:hypothetical protein